MNKYEYVERFYKRYKVTPILMRRALGTALSVIEHLQNVDFTDLTFTAFGICAGNQYQELVRPFEQQLELAKVKEEYFVDHLHDFYLAMAKKLRKDTNPYFDLLAFIHDRLFEVPIAERDKKVFHVYCAYMDLIMQMEEYLHPNQSDYNEQIVGIKTDGTLICKQEPLQNLDVAIYEYERQVLKRQGNDLDVIRQVFSRYGYYSIKTEEDVKDHNAILRSYDNNIMMMIPLINEYTYDLLPENLANMYFRMPQKLKMDYKPDKGRFSHRRRTLPSNGVTIRIEGNPILREIRMKELYHADAIYMIARCRLAIGDYMVRFNTATGVYLSTFLNATNPEATKIHKLLESATLWLYASYVLDDESGQWEDLFDGRVADKEAVGGKLRMVYGNKKKIDRENLEQSDRTISGYVRKLPVGQKASDEARDRAEKLGFDLDDGETYVQSFIRSSWVVKARS